MRLTDLHLEPLPGLRQAVDLDLSGHITLIHGPNGSGKSTLCDALWFLLWPDEHRGRTLPAAAGFRHGGRGLRADGLDGSTVTWTADGQPCDPPPVPSGHIAQCYRVHMLDLVTGQAGPVDKDLARELRAQMYGGYDPEQAADRFRTGARSGYTERSALTEARRERMEIHGRHEALAGREQRLDQLQVQHEAALAAGGRQRQLGRLADRARALAERAMVQREMAVFPAGQSRLQPDDADQLATLRAEERNGVTARDRQAAEIAHLEARLADLAPPDADHPPDPDAAAGLAARLRELQDRRDTTERARDKSAGGQTDVDHSGVTPDHYRRFTALHADLTEHDARLAVAETILRDLDRDPAPGTRPHLPGWIAGGLLAVAGAAVLFLVTPPTGTFAGGGLLLAGAAALAWAGRQTGEAAAERRRSGAARQIAETALADVREARAATLKDLALLCEDTGLDPETDRPELLHDLKALAQRQDDQAEARRNAAELVAFDTQIAAALVDLNVELGRAGLPAADDAVTAGERVGRLRSRITDRAVLTESLRQAHSNRDLADRQLEQCRQRISGLLERLGLADADDPDTEVKALAGGSRRWADLVARDTALDLDLARLQADLQANRDALDPAPLLGRTVEDLDRLAAEAGAEADRAATLQDEITTTRTEIRLARQGDELEKAMAKEAACRDALTAVRDRQRDDALALLLLDRVRRRNEQTTRPEILQTAMDLLADFTAGRYRLLVDTTTDGLGFRAEETGTGRLLDLHQLSDGTRAQLLLAVRLAFITRAEDGLALPLFLDDSLTVSDPVRFDDIAGGLAALAAKQDRQIIYLTPAPADVIAWQRALARRDLPPANVIDLGRYRDRAAADPDLDLPPLPELPSPDGTDAATYGRRLGVPAADPWLPATALHLFHLLRDDLPLLHRLLAAGVATVGAWETRGPTLLRAGQFSGTEADTLAHRVRIWQGVLDGWKIGRGRRVTTDDITRSKAVSKTMLPKVLAVVTDRDGDGPGIMDALDKGAVARFHQDKKNLLQEYLEQEGCLDTRQVLDGEGLQSHVLSGVASEVRRGKLAPAEVRVLVHQLAGSLDGSP